MNLLINILRNISAMLVTAPMIFIIIALAVFLYSKNKKIIYMQKLICGGSVNSCMELTLSQLVLGVIGGCVGSIILCMAGVVFENSYTIVLIFLVSIILLNIKPKFICFSYSGAVIGCISIFIELLEKMGIYIENSQYFKVDIMPLMMFVGIMHIVEGFLVMLDGHRGAVPVFGEKDGKIFGGYSLRRYWTVPIIMITTSSLNNSVFNSSVVYEIPNWWASIPYMNMAVIGSAVGLMLLNFFGVIGYSSVTFTRNKHEKAVLSGCFIAAFGVVLTIVSQLASLGIIGQIIVVILAPIGHELIFKLQSMDENRREPKFISNTNGLAVLETAEDSVLKEHGIEIGSRILSVNNQKVSSEQDIYSAIKENLYNAVIEIMDSKGFIKEIKFRHKKNSRLGIVVVPEAVKKEDVVEINSESFKNILEEIKKKHNKI